MAKVQCPKCSHTYSGHPLKGKAAATAGAFIGGYLGSGVGIAGGPLGAIAGTVPGAALGGIIGYFGSSSFYKCPSCGKYFKL